MGNFLITVGTVAIMLAYAVPGFFFIKSKLIPEGHIPSFARLLLFVCQPCLTVYSFQEATKAVNAGVIDQGTLAVNMLIFLAVTGGIQCAMLFGFNYIFQRKSDDAKHRVCAIATAFGNSGFFGIPVLQTLLRDHPEAVIYSTVFFLCMNVLAWTVASAMITKDKSYISIKKAVLNPATFALIFALPMFIFRYELPSEIGSMITLLGKFSTPLCMIILGMRLATVDPKSLFGDRLQYLAVAIKTVGMPLIAFAVVYFLPVSLTIKETAVILCACPVANIVLSFAEMLGQGQKVAANTVLLSTILSIISLPTVLLLLPLLH